MRILMVLGALMITAIGPSAAFATPPTMADMKAACKFGEGLAPPAATGGNMTPATVEGVETVSAAEAKCIFDRFGKEVVVIAAMRNDEHLPGAVLFPEAGSRSDDTAVQTRIVQRLNDLSRGDKTRPLLFYCSSEACSASLYAVQRARNGGFKSVLWLRSGINGWMKAKYPFVVPSIDPLLVLTHDHGILYAKEFARCNVGSLTKTPRSYADEVATLASTEVAKAWKATVRTAQNNRKVCIAKLIDEYVGYPGPQADARAKLPSSDADVATHMANIAAIAEADPSTHFGWVLKHPRDEAQIYLANAAKFRTAPDQCGTFNFTIPPVDNQVMTARRNEWKTYSKCLEEWNKMRPLLTIPQIVFNNNVLRIEHVERFTCSRFKRSTCIADEAWKREAAFFSRANDAIIKRAAAAEQFPYYAEMNRLQKWWDDLNNKVNAHNARH